MSSQPSLPSCRVSPGVQRLPHLALFPPQTRENTQRAECRMIRPKDFKFAGEAKKNLYLGYSHSLGNYRAHKALLIPRSWAQEQQYVFIHNVCCSVCEPSHGRCSLSVFICQIKASDGEAPSIIKDGSTVAFCQIHVATGNGRIKHVLWGGLNITSLYKCN